MGNLQQFARVDAVEGRTAIPCEPLIDATEAGAILKVHPKTAKRLAAEGVIPAMKIGKLWRFRASALDAWMNSQLHSSGHPCPEKRGGPK
ncbi:MAG: helix-turn-helix domain-containing protein [Terriglobales bacterium]